MHAYTQADSDTAASAGRHPAILTCIHACTQTVRKTGRQTDIQRERQANRRPRIPTNIYGQEYITHTYRESNTNMDTYIQTDRQPDGKPLIKAGRGRHAVTQTNMHTYIRAYTLAYIHIHTHA